MIKSHQATHPLDVLDARQQTARASASGIPPGSILTLEPWRGLARDPACLVRGLVQRILALAPGTWLFFAVFAPARRALLDVLAA